MTRAGLSFGIETSQAALGYREILSTWQEADSLSVFEQAFLPDRAAPPSHPARARELEAWTLLGALSARTSRLRLGVIGSDNRLRPPAVLAKLAATVDVVSGGRLVFGVRAGGDPGAGGPGERHDGEPGEGAAGKGAAGDVVGALAEALVIARRMWTEPEPFDFDGRFYRLRGAVCEPKPLQRPGPTVLVCAGAGQAELQIVAEQADVWCCPASSPTALARMGAALEERCAEIGRDPETIARCVRLAVSGGRDGAKRARERVLAFASAGATKVVLAGPSGQARWRSSASWLAEEVVQPVLDRLG